MPKKPPKIMTRFQADIAANDKTLSKRAASLSQAAALAQEALINKLKTEISNRELELSSELDFAPETTDSLRPGKTKTSDQMNEWVKKVQKIKWEIFTAKQQLALAEETYKEYFTPLEENSDGPEAAE